MELKRFKRRSNCPKIVRIPLEATNFNGFKELIQGTI